jgi:hypothetical protein
MFILDAEFPKLSDTVDNLLFTYWSINQTYKFWAVCQLYLISIQYLHDIILVSYVTMHCITLHSIAAKHNQELDSSTVFTCEVSAPTYFHLEVKKKR